MSPIPEIHLPLALRRMAAAMMVPVPRGFVRMMPCPAFMRPLLIKLPSLATPVTLKPAQHATGVRNKLLEQEDLSMIQVSLQTIDTSHMYCTCEHS